MSMQERQKRYREKHREKLKQKRADNKEYQKQYRITNRTSVQEQCQRWREEHREYCREKERLRRCGEKGEGIRIKDRLRNSTEERKAWQRDRKYIVTRYKKDSAFAALICLRSRVSAALRGKNKSAPTLALLGCSLADALRHVSDLFQSGMSWENRGSVWELDHKKPFCHFPDLSDPAQQRVACHFSNLQPLFITEHAAKTAEDVRVAPAARKNFS